LHYPRLRNPIWFVRKERTVSLADNAYSNITYVVKQVANERDIFKCVFVHAYRNMKNT